MVWCSANAKPVHAATQNLLTLSYKNGVINLTELQAASLTSNTS
jgi:hypothetical protein